MNILDKDGYILAAITGTLYFQSFMGLLAQSFFYEIPLELLPLDVMRVAYTSLFFVSLIAVFIGLYFFYILFKKSKNPNYLRFAWLFAFAGYPVITFFALKDIDVRLAIALSLLWLLVQTWRAIKNKDNVFKIFKGNSWHYKDDSDEGLKYVLLHSKGFLLTWIIILVFPGMFLMSYFNCYKKTEYDVFYKGGYFAVISYSSDNVIVKKIKNHRLEDGYYILKTDFIESERIIKRNIQLLPEVAPSGSPASPARLASLR